MLELASVNRAVTRTLNFSVPRVVGHSLDAGEMSDSGSGHSLVLQGTSKFGLLGNAVPFGLVVNVPDDDQDSVRWRRISVASEMHFVR